MARRGRSRLGGVGGCANSVYSRPSAPTRFACGPARGARTVRKLTPIFSAGREATRLGGVQAQAAWGSRGYKRARRGLEGLQRGSDGDFTAALRMACRGGWVQNVGRRRTCRQDRSGACGGRGFCGALEALGCAF
eukprot:1256325-Pyramimonas_sp.AAC.1